MSTLPVQTTRFTLIQAPSRQQIASVWQFKTTLMLTCSSRTDGTRTVFVHVARIENTETGFRFYATEVLSQRQVTCEIDTTGNINTGTLSIV